MLIFVMPDPACFKWNAVDYAAIGLAAYSLLLTVSAFTVLKSARLAAVVLILAVIGTWLSFLIWKLPQERVECDGTVWPVGNVR